MPAPFLSPGQNGQRDQITQALMNIANPPPQMPQQQPGMAPPPQMGAPSPQAGQMPPQQGMPQAGAPVGAAQPAPMMAGALGGLMPQQPQQQQPMQPQQQMPPQGM